MSRWMIFTRKLVCRKFSLFSTSVHSIWFVHFHIVIASCLCVYVQNGASCARHLTSSFNVGIVFIMKSRNFFNIWSCAFFLLHFELYFASFFPSSVKLILCYIFLKYVLHSTAHKFIIDEAVPMPSGISWNGFEISMLNSIHLNCDRNR